MTENTSSNTAPYFGIGEEVILESKYHPECNGEYAIKDLRYGKGIDVATGEVAPGWDYDLGFTTKHGDTEFVWWAQAALRKKYPPSEMSFSEMLESFNKKIVEAI